MRLEGMAGEAAATPLLRLQLAAKVGPMAARGLAVRWRLRSSRGLLLVGRGVRIRNPQFISTGAGVVIEDFAEIQGRSIEGIHIGDGVTIGAFATIRPSGYYRRDPGVGLQVGDRSNIGTYCYLGCSGGIQIGNDVLMGPRVSLEAENHDFDRLDVPIRDQGVTRGRIVVEDGCWLATGSVVLPGVTVGKGAVVAAGAVVTRDVPALAVVAGVPARVIRPRRVDDGRS